MARSNRLVSLRGSRKSKTKQVQDARLALRSAVSKYSKVCRTLFRNDEAVLAKLGLKGRGPLPHADADFLDRARILFNTTEYTEPMRAKLATRKYDDARFAAERARIDALELAREQARSVKGLQRTGTQEKKAAVKAAWEWHRDFRATAKTELADKPQLLEKIGIVVREGRTQAQRQAPRKAAARRSRKVAPMAA